MDLISIDLGINTATTDGKPGFLTEPFPLQIGLSRGTLDKEGAFVSGIETVSFRELVSREQLILRTFDITPPGASPERLLQVPLFLQITFRTLLGITTTDPWTASGKVAGLTLPKPEICLSLASREQKQFPCYRQVDANQAPVIYQLLDVTEPSSYLTSFLLGASVIEKAVSENRYFGTDPEMVVGPYDGGNRRSPQSGLAAASR